MNVKRQRVVNQSGGLPNHKVIRLFDQMITYDHMPNFKSSICIPIPSQMMTMDIELH